MRYFVTRGIFGLFGLEIINVISPEIILRVVTTNNVLCVISARCYFRSLGNIFDLNL